MDAPSVPQGKGRPSAAPILLKSRLSDPTKQTLIALLQEQRSEEDLLLTGAALSQDQRRHVGRMRHLRLMIWEVLCPRPT